MARPKKATVDYFPHKCNHGKTLFILENKFGNDGYAFWFKLLELLGSTEGHFYDFNPAPEKQFLLAKTRVTEDTAAEILKTLSDVEAIDPELWDVGLIWSDNFIENVSDAYAKRIDTLPTKEGLRLLKPHLFSRNGVSDNGSTESKVKESKVKESRRKHIVEIVEYLNEKAGTNFKSTTKKTRTLIQARINEDFTLEDFKTVINKIVPRWQKKPDMIPYIRPETLFGTKFEGYLNFKESSIEDPEWLK